MGRPAHADRFEVEIGVGDDQWAAVVRWTLYAMLEAEEKGVTQANVDEMLKSPEPLIQNLLGVKEGNGKALGLDEKWAYTVIKQVGNYGESFERNVGQGSPLKLQRGVNAQDFDFVGFGDTETGSAFERGSAVA